MDIEADFDSIINKAITYASDLSNIHDYDLIKNFKGYGIVYFIYIINKRGKSKGYLFKTRIKNHFYKKHQRTGSKLAAVKKELLKGNKVKIKFLKVTPESFRNTLEEELIAHFQPIWNIQKKKG